MAPTTTTTMDAGAGSGGGGGAREAECIFEAYRAVGSVTTGACGASLHSRGNTAFVTTAVGRTWHLYTLAKLQLKLVGPQHPGTISHLRNKVRLTRKKQPGVPSLAPPTLSSLPTLPTPYAQNAGRSTRLASGL